MARPAATSAHKDQPLPEASGPVPVCGSEAGGAAGAPTDMLTWADRSSHIASTTTVPVVFPEYSVVDTVACAVRDEGSAVNRGIAARLLGNLERAAGSRHCGALLILNGRSNGDLFAQVRGRTCSRKQDAAARLRVLCARIAN